MEPVDKSPSGEVTRLLRLARSGDADALDQLVPLVYDELRELARRQLRREKAADTVRATALVHEAYMKLAGGPVEASDRPHFLAIAARAMRQVLVDQARRRDAAKRGGGWERTTLGEAHHVLELRSDELVALDDALALLEPRQRQVVEMRFFGGMEEREIGEVLGVSESTVRRDWDSRPGVALPGALPGFRNVNRRQRIEALFDAALERPEAERTAWLAAECDDADVRAEVEALLAAHRRAAGILEVPLARSRPRLAHPPEPDRFGPYRVTGIVGRGGMGVVYLAERDDGQFRQRVAVKVIAAGPDIEELQHRLEAERRILAALNHPSIARLLDGGVTADGRPYLVMEYVEGTPIDVYCDEHRLTVSERLQLFCAIAHAVHHAHRSLVVHRDLKPSNVLVTPEAAVKLLDFGIAKILDPERFGGSSPETRTGLLLLTPEYAAPEQLLGAPASTANDVYSLGVMLYELLVGRRPFDLAGRSLTECERIILQHPPPRPSTVWRRSGTPQPVIEAIGSARRTTLEKLERQLRGDLDRIVLQALRKEPDLRYRSVEQLAEDVERYLDGRPVLARGSSPGYRARKFVQRHRWGVAASAVLAFSLLAGAVGTSVQARRAARERDRAAAEASRAARVSALMMDLFRLTDPTRTLGDTITARQILDEGAERIMREFGDDPFVQATMLTDVARIYENLGLIDRAEALVRRVIDLREALGAESAEMSESLGQLARLLAARGEREEAVERYRRAIAIRSRVLPEPDTLLAQFQAALGWEVRGMRGYDEASQLFESALATQRRLRGDDAPQVAEALLGLGAVHHEAGRFDEAEAVFERALAGYDTASATPSPIVATALLNVAMIRELRGRFTQAEPLLEKAVAMRGALYPADHPAVIETLDRRGALLHALGRYAEAERTLVDGLERATASLGTTHPMTEGMRETLAFVLLSLGRYDEATARFDSVLVTKRARLGDDHPGVVFTLVGAAEPPLLAGSLDLAEQRYGEAREMADRGLGAASIYRALALNGLARIAIRRNELDNAASLLNDARSVLDAQLRAEHRYVLTARRTYAELLLARGRPREAVQELQAVHELQRNALPSPHPNHAATLLLLARAQQLAGAPADAQRTLTLARPHLSLLDSNHPLSREAASLTRRQ